MRHRSLLCVFLLVLSACAPADAGGYDGTVTLATSCPGGNASAVIELALTLSRLGGEVLVDGLCDDGPVAGLADGRSVTLERTTCAGTTLADGDTATPTFLPSSALQWRPDSLGVVVEANEVVSGPSGTDTCTAAFVGSLPVIP